MAPADDAVSPESPFATPEPVRLHSLPIERSQPDAVAPKARSTAPTELTSFIGREEDVKEVCTLILAEGVRLVTLTGPGGVGKTRLALRIAETLAGSFPDGVAFVSLAAITDPELVLPTIVRTLGLREDAARSVAEVLSDALRQKRLLLVLDNFEQVRSCAPTLVTLLAQCADLVILVTSRALLHVAGEQRVLVAPLPLPAPSPTAVGHPAVDQIAAAPAIQLFVARARSIDHTFALNAANASEVAAICRRLDGLPLAIELAASQILLLAPSELLTRLQPALPLLDEGPSDAPERQSTMRAAIAWSYDLLSPREQALFRRLAVFVGGFSLQAAERVGGDEGEPFLKTISRLVDMSLLQRIGAVGETRFGILETIREFGLERLAASGETNLIAARHAAWCVEFADLGRRSGYLSQGRGLAALEAEHPNLRAALGWLLSQDEAMAAQHLAAQIAEFWLRHIHNWSEGQAWLERALSSDTGRPTTARAEALVGLSMLQWPRHAYDRATELLAEAEAIGHAVDDPGAIAYARLHQGYVALFRGDLDLALARGEELQTTCHAIRQGFNCNGALWLLARTTLARGDDDRAMELYRRLLAGALATGDEISIVNGHLALAMLAERRGDWADMLARYADAAVVCRGIGDVWIATQSLEGAAAAATGLDRLEPAVRLFAAAAALRDEIRAAPTPGHVGSGYERQAQTARAALGRERFAAIWAAGAALSFDEALSEVAELAKPAPVGTGADHVAPHELTPRERDVLRLLVGGMTDKEIAAALGIGHRTVSGHVEAIRAKLEAPSRTAAVAIALRDGLV